MPKIFHTDNLPPLIGPWENLLVYNGFDCGVTAEVAEVLTAQMDEPAKLLENFAYACHAPALVMMRRGIKIDLAKRSELIEKYSETYEKVYQLLSRIGFEGFGINLMAKRDVSRGQLKRLLYEGLKLPIQYSYDKATKERKVSVNRESLEKLEAEYAIARPLIFLVKSLRDTLKKLQILQTAIDPDGRMRCSYQVSGPYTGRWASNDSAFYTGTNLQNIADLMREMFVADDGWKMGNVDLKQAEAKCVAYDAEDEYYIDACLSGDIHTYVAKLCYPDVNWPNDLVASRKLAEEKFYRDFSRRDLSKRGAHASNYYAKPFTISRHLKISMPVAVQFQTNYFRAFPGIPNWHMRIARDIATSNCIVTPTGRRIFFFGSPYIDDTLKNAIAAGPQSMTGDILNTGLWKLWANLESKHPDRFQILGQIHDAVLFQYRPAWEEWVLKRVCEEIRIPLMVRGREMVLDPDVSVGWNWRKQGFDKKTKQVVNLHGLAEWKGSDARRAPDPAKAPSLLSRRICQTY